MIKLPKDLVEDARHDAIAQLLATNVERLWESAHVSVPTVPLTQDLVNVLRHALHTNLATQGLESITEKLATEQLGLDAVNNKPRVESADNLDNPAGRLPAPRASRLLFVANDGSKRFYRDCDGLLTRYAQRLVACRIDIAGECFGERLFGSPKMVRSVLVHDKKVVSRALLALLAQ